MDLNEQKQQFSIAFVRAVAASCGLAYAMPGTDDDSIDATIALRGGNGTVRSPKLDIQIKCTAAVLSGSTHLSLPLPLKNYDELRPENVQVARILVLVCVPDDVADWMACTESQFVLRKCAYWVSLRGAAESANSTRINVSVPCANVFDPATLRMIFNRLQQGQQP